MKLLKLPMVVEPVPRSMPRPCLPSCENGKPVGSRGDLHAKLPSAWVATVSDDENIPHGSPWGSIKYQKVGCRRNT